MKGRASPGPLEIARSSGEGRKDFNDSREDDIGALSKSSSWEWGSYPQCGLVGGTAPWGQNWGAL